MRKLTTVLFLSIFLFQAFGYFFTYRLIKWHIRKEVTSQISSGFYHSSALSCISLTQAQLSSLEWEEENEFCYQKEWYDVVDVKQSGELTIYYCIKDEQETRLVAHFDSLLQNLDQESTEGTFLYTLKKLSDDYYSEFTITIEHRFIEQSVFFYDFHSSVLQVTTSQQDPPPPKA